MNDYKLLAAVIINVLYHISIPISYVQWKNNKIIHR